MGLELCFVVLTLFSMYGHINTMAHTVAKGVRSTGAEASLFQVPETLSPEVLKLLKAPPKDANVPVIDDPSTITPYDGVLFGSGTRFGMMTAQLKAFFDKTGGIWAKGQSAWQLSYSGTELESCADVG